MNTVRYPVSQPTIGEAERVLVDEVIRSGWITQGPVVATFERQLANYFDVKHVVATANGTVALHLALVALGIGPGDEVLVPDLTFVATANAVRYTGATPVLVDIDPSTWNIDLDDAARLVTDKTAAVLPVHLYGVPCNMSLVLDFAATFGLKVVEDAAQALSGRWLGHACGTMGDVGTYSFFGNKSLTTGEGGALVTDNEDVAKQARFLRGQAMDAERRYFHAEVGFNYRMTDLQAAVGVGQMVSLAERLEQRHAVCQRYLARLREVGYTSLQSVHRPLARFNPWLFTTVLDEPREDVARRLAEAGVETRPTFVPLHRLPMYRGLDEDFPQASFVGDRGLSLPTYAGLPLEAVDEICDLICQP